MWCGCIAMNRSAPCRECAYRFPGCHAICMKYEAWVLTREKQKRASMKEKAADEVAIVGCQRQKERLRKKRGR